MSVYAYEYISMENKQTPMSDYEGKVLLIVNTASKCGFTPQYQGLEELYKAYGSRDFAVIGFPCDQFNDQEYETEKEIQEQCLLRFGVTFPMSKKVEVRGENATDLFRYLTAQKGFEGLGKGAKAMGLTAMLKVKYGSGFSDEQIKWNFTKFLIDRQGNVVARYEPTVEPKDIAADIEALL